VRRHQPDLGRGLEARPSGLPVDAAFARRWREEVITAWSEGGQAPRDGGVYWQARGPRFETPAEIRLMAAHAHVVGMTIASECVVAGELGLDYAALCVVDNLANGLGEDEVSIEELEADRLINAERLREGLAAVLPRLGAVGR
jgi:purine nucleoside phosphorylase